MTRYIDERTLDLFADFVPAVAEPEVEQVEPLVEVADLDVVGLAPPAPLSDQPLLFNEIPARVQTVPVRLLSVYVHFENRDDLADFARLIGQPLTSETQRIWYPPEVAYSGAIWDEKRDDA